MVATASFVLLILALVTQIVWILARSGKDNLLSFILLPLATLGLFIDLTIRSFRISFVAITNTYEALIFLSGALGLVLSWLQLRSRRRSGNKETSGYGGSIFPFVIFGGSLL